MYDEDEDEEGYDLSPDEDELELDELVDEDEESDELDDLDNPRITEIDSDGEEAPKLVNAKGKNKRSAEDSDEDADLDDLIAKAAKSKGATNGETNLSKKQQKKLKKNNGEAAPVDAKKESKEAKGSKGAKEVKEAREAAAPSKSDKKVQFAKNLERGPSPSPQEKKPAAEKSTGTLGVKEVGGVTIDDKKLGNGPAAKNGNTVSMRYIGKLEDGKVFDG
jgi:FK506-binding nuclear protein